MEHTNFVDSFCQVLLQKKLFKPEDIEVLKKQFADRSEAVFEDFLLDEGLVSKEDLLGALSAYYNVPAVDVVGHFFDHHLVVMFPLDVMVRNGFIPYERDGDILVVIAANPNNPTLPEVVSQFVSYDTACLVGLHRDICDAAIEYHDVAITEVDRELRSIDDEEREQHEVHDFIDEPGHPDEEL